MGGFQSHLENSRVWGGCEPLLPFQLSLQSLTHCHADHRACSES